MPEKVCFKCGVLKPMSEFYVHPRMHDKHLGKCKDCTRMDSENRRHKLQADNPSWVKREIQRQRDKAHQYEIDYPEKLKAHRAIASMKKKQGIHLHHWSYLPEDRRSVIELSGEQHRLVHRYMIYDKERALYRTMTGELLDSKVSAMRYYDDLCKQHGVK